MDPIRVVFDLAQLPLEVLDLSLQSKDLGLFVLSDWQRSSVGCALSGPLFTQTLPRLLSSQ